MRATLSSKNSELGREAGPVGIRVTSLYREADPYGQSSPALQMGLGGNTQFSWPRKDSTYWLLPGTKLPWESSPRRSVSFGPSLSPALYNNLPDTASGTKGKVQSKTVVLDVSKPDHRGWEQLERVLNGIPVGVLGPWHHFKYVFPHINRLRSE